MFYLLLALNGFTLISGLVLACCSKGYEEDDEKIMP
jgi:hypothetical protein